MIKGKEVYAWALLRLSIGFIFLWSFFDKLFGLGFSTSSNQAWILGNSPTTGFLLNATKGPFIFFFQSLANNVMIDWLFMMGLLFVGIMLTFNIKTRLAGYTGALMLFLMWLAVLPPEHNPFLDDHIINIIILISLTFVKSDKIISLKKLFRKSFN